MQRDNKIHVLESKLNGGVPPAKSNQKAALGANSNAGGGGVAGKQREIGKLPKEQAQRKLIDGIKKHPGAAA